MRDFSLSAPARTVRQLARAIEHFLRRDLNDLHLAGVVGEIRENLDVEFNATNESTEPSVVDRLTTEKTYMATARKLFDSIRKIAATLQTQDIKQKVASPKQTAVRSAIEKLTMVEPAVLNTLLGLERIESPGLYVLVDGCGSEARLRETVELLVRQKVALIQLRDKTMSDQQLVLTGRKIKQWTNHSKTQFIMNDRADLALLANADGVHLGQDDIEIEDARKILGAAKLIGRSTHSIEQARQAVLEGASYIGVGPVFQSETKNFSEFVGLDLVRAVSREIKLPAFAIGGIKLDNLAGVKQSGMFRVAVSSAVVKNENPEHAVTQLMTELRS